MLGPRFSEEGQAPLNRGGSLGTKEWLQKRVFSCAATVLEEASMKSQESMTEVSSMQGSVVCDSSRSRVSVEMQRFQLTQSR